TSSVAELARARSLESAQRREEADLAAEMAQLLLGSADLDAALARAGERLAAAVGVPSAALARRAVPAGADTAAVALPRDGARCDAADECKRERGPRAGAGRLHAPGTADREAPRPLRAAGRRRRAAAGVVLHRRGPRRGGRAAERQRYRLQAVRRRRHAP